MPSLTNRHWIIPSELHTASDQLAVELALARGITNTESLLDPLLMPGIEKAMNRIQQAIQNKEKIGIFGDYDADGVTAAAILTRYFTRQNIEPHVVLPHRVHDGYGLKPISVEKMQEEGVSLIVTVDNGIAATSAAEYAKECGIDLIITDHHEIGPSIPEAHAIVHPGMDRSYPEPHPCGAGVAYQLVRALEGDSWEGKEIDTIFAMIGTVADVMSLTAHNRALVIEGLNACATTTHRPLEQLFMESSVEPTSVSSTDIGFRIAPRINAAGRMEDPDIALQALLHGELDVMRLSKLNTERQELTRALFEECVASIDTSGPLLFTASKNYTEGTVGLLAGRLTEQFGKPSLVACIRENHCTASLRSVPGYNVALGLHAIEDHLFFYGGHERAAGCSFGINDLDTVRDSLAQHIKTQCDVRTMGPQITIDAQLETNMITLDFVRNLSSLEPFGEGNLEPRFLLKNVLIDHARRIGNDQSHLQGSINNIRFVGFGLGDLIEETQKPLDVVCRVGINSWNGTETPQLFLEDMRNTQV